MGYPPRLWIAMAAGVPLALSGCATTETPRPASPGHPAHVDTDPAPMDRAQTLAESEPVETAPARSQHWAEQAEEHERPPDRMIHEHEAEPRGHDHNDQNGTAEGAEHHDAPQHDDHE